ncbi:ABC-type multidrug transport system, ATPase and permease component [Seinonella peptonophila]|uniref:ABC-type multidrug transport system, ATPase and permease component n=1 Tax=Seinonella peptonophila TaxID=112248 RepID=A0A1M4Z6B8_9BACL|nr:ABC transporter ATP-binding protein [Seinonella peptonophila]SHF13332.1 ABC-type multidrug transport system, ATPase and permease component [Seinonella peptonophila]
MDTGKKKEKARVSGKRELFRSTSSSKSLLAKVLLLALLEAVSSALIPLALKQMLENPGKWTILGYASSLAVQVGLLVMFFEYARTFQVVMGQYLMERLARQLEDAALEPLSGLRRRFGQVHSSLVQKLVDNFGRDLPIMIKDAWIVMFQQVGICLAFGVKYLLISALGLLIMSCFVYLAVREKKRFSERQKKLDGALNNHIDSMTEQLVVFQETRTTGLKRDHVRRVTGKIVQLFLETAWKRFLLVVAPRTLPTLVSVWSVLMLAVSEGHSLPQLSMISGFMETTLVVSYSCMLLFLNMADSQGNLRHLEEALNSPKRPEGSDVVGPIDALSLSQDLCVTLPSGRKLFLDGLFPNHPRVKELIFKAGQFYILVGPSGSGKTRLVEIVARRSENVADEGIKWSGTYRIKSSGSWMSLFSTTLSSFCKYIFYCSQRASYVDGVRADESEAWQPGTVRDNIGLHLESADCSSERMNQVLDQVTSTLKETVKPLANDSKQAEWKERLVHLIAWIVELDHLDQEVGTLSGGEAIRCMLGRALVGAMLVDRPVLILDETFSQLDSGTALRILKRLRILMRLGGGCVIMVSHSHELNPADAIVLVFGSNGRGIIETGRVAELSKRESSEYNKVLRAC